MASLQIGQMINEYRILGRLGEGGMGVVYKALDTALDRVVAVKTIGAGLADDKIFWERFRREAKALAKLDDPNIVTIFALRETEVGLLMVMEFVDGMTLSQKIKQNGPIGYDEALPIIKQILTALGHAHQDGIIHRDIKPGNVMLNAKGEVKVTDFGLAKIQQTTERTLTMFPVGTLRYMSPEQVRDIANVDQRSDLYSLGMTFYEMLAGRLPFEANEENYYALVKIIVEQEFFSPRQFNPELPKRLSDIVIKALAKNPEERFQNAEEMLQAIERFERETITIPIPPPPPAPTPAPIPVLPKPNGGKKRLRSLSLAISVILLVVALGVYKFLENSSAPKKSNPPISIDSTKSEPDSTRPTHSALIKELSGITETKILQNKLAEYSRAMQIAVGNEDDFESPEGCYVFVCDAQRVLGVFQFKGNVYYAVNSAETYAKLPKQFSGEIAIWVQDSSVQ